MACSVWGAKCIVWSEECKVWSEECKGSAKCGAWRE